MKTCVVVLHLLLLNQIAQSFVLLTANIEDIKKLAKKFVSESLAEKIAEFIAKATEQMITNVSEENERNEDGFLDVSRENNKLYNIGRQRNQNANRPKPKHRYHNTKEDPPKKTFKKAIKTTKKAIDRPKRLGRFDLKSLDTKEVQNTSIAKKEPEKSFEKYKNVKQYSYTVKERPKSPKSTEIPKLDSTIGIAEKIHPDADSKPTAVTEESQSKFLSPNRFRLTGNSKENGTIQPNDFDSFQKVLTTKRERNEFDQYDNPKYPKAEYIATSGPVVLPKIPSEDWYNKGKKFKKNKPWD